MEPVRVEATVAKDGSIRIDGLEPGEEVVITVQRKTKELPRSSLYGSVTKYERPFDPVGLEDWDALK